MLQLSNNMRYYPLNLSKLRDRHSLHLLPQHACHSKVIVLFFYGYAKAKRA